MRISEALLATIGRRATVLHADRRKSARTVAPWPHWVDQCASGTDHMISSASVGIDLDLDCRPETELLPSGPVHVR